MPSTNHFVDLTLLLLHAAAEQLERRKREDRPSLFTDNWGGDEWKGGNVNILTVIIFVSVAVPAVGLIFAYFTYGTLWG